MISSMKRRGDDSFRVKLLSVLRVSLIVGLVLTGAAVVVVQTYLSIGKLKADLEVVANILGDRSVAALVFDDTAAATRNLQAAKFHPSLVSACLYSRSGKLFAHYQAVSSKNACSPNYNKPGAHKVWLDRGLFNHSLISIIEDLGESQGWIVLEANSKNIQNTLFIFILLTSVILLMITTASTALANRLLDRAMEPLEDLHNTATAISNEILSHRRAIKNSDDEIGELVDVFNRMLDSVASETRALTISEERFRTLTSNAPIGIFQLDHEFNLEYANEKWQQITGLYSKEGAFDKHQLNVIPEDIPRYKKYWRDNKDSTSTALLEYRYQKDQEEICHLVEYVSPLLRSSDERKGYIGTLFDVTELKNAQIELEKLAFYDPLTNLPNRRFFRDHLDLKLSEAKRTVCNLAVLMVDLDDFKNVNDTLGHDVGDELLQKVAEKLKAVVRDQDVVSRMGGDEFLILLTSDVDGDMASTLAQRILDEVGEPHIVRDKQSLSKMLILLFTMLKNWVAVAPVFIQKILTGVYVKSFALNQN
jgi:diguanylate cyclase (GGDEF)-like protein/PAS domain S-box-containing protein